MAKMLLQREDVNLDQGNVKRAQRHQVFSSEVVYSEPYRSRNPCYTTCNIQRPILLDYSANSSHEYDISFPRFAWLNWNVLGA